MIEQRTYTPPQKALAIVASGIGIALTIVATILMWPVADTVQRQVQILALPVASTFGILALLGHAIPWIRDLRFVFFGFLLTFTTNSPFVDTIGNIQYSASVNVTSNTTVISGSPSSAFLITSVDNFKVLYDSFSNSVSGSTTCPLGFAKCGSQEVTGYFLAYAALVTLTLALSFIVAREDILHPAIFRSKWAIAGVLVALGTGAAGFGILFWKAEGMNVINRSYLYATVAVPTAVNLIVLIGAPLFHNLLACYGSILIVVVRCFWILPVAFQYDSTQTSDSIVFIAILLCWGSALVSLATSFLVALIHSQNSFDPENMDTIVDTSKGQHREVTAYIMIIFGVLMLVAGTVGIFIGNSGNPLDTTWQLKVSSGFLNAEFVVLALAALVCFITNENFDRSKFRYCYFGLFIYITLQGRNHITVFFENIYNAFLGSHASTQYGLTSTSKTFLVGVGELASIVGILFSFFFVSGRFRRKCHGGSVGFFVSLFLFIAGIYILFASIYTANVHLGTSLRTFTIQCLIAPSFIATFLAYSSLFHISIEATHALLFCIGYCGYWILPNAYAFQHYFISKDQDDALDGGIISFVCVAVLVLVGMAGVQVHEKDKDPDKTKPQAEGSATNNPTSRSSLLPQESSSTMPSNVMLAPITPFPGPEAYPFNMQESAAPAPPPFPAAGFQSLNTPAPPPFPAMGFQSLNQADPRAPAPPPIPAMGFQSLAGDQPPPPPAIPAMGFQSLQQGQTGQPNPSVSKVNSLGYRPLTSRSHDYAIPEEEVLALMREKSASQEPEGYDDIVNESEEAALELKPLKRSSKDADATSVSSESKEGDILTGQAETAFSSASRPDLPRYEQPEQFFRTEGDDEEHDGFEETSFSAKAEASSAALANLPRYELPEQFFHTSDADQSGTIQPRSLIAFTEQSDTDQGATGLRVDPSHYVVSNTPYQLFTTGALPAVTSDLDDDSVVHGYLHMDPDEITNSSRRPPPPIPTSYEDFVPLKLHENSSHANDQQPIYGDDDEPQPHQPQLDDNQAGYGEGDEPQPHQPQLDDNQAGYGEGDESNGQHAARPVDDETEEQDYENYHPNDSEQGIREEVAISNDVEGEGYRGTNNEESNPVHQDSTPYYQEGTTDLPDYDDVEQPTAQPLSYDQPQSVAARSYYDEATDPDHEQENLASYHRQPYEGEPYPSNGGDEEADPVQETHEQEVVDPYQSQENLAQSYQPQDSEQHEADLPEYDDVEQPTASYDQPQSVDAQSYHEEATEADQPQESHEQEVVDPYQSQENLAQSYQPQENEQHEADLPEYDDVEQPTAQPLSYDPPQSVAAQSFHEEAIEADQPQESHEQEVVDPYQSQENLAQSYQPQDSEQHEADLPEYDDVEQPTANYDQPQSVDAQPYHDEATEADQPQESHEQEVVDPYQSQENLAQSYQEQGDEYQPQENEQQEADPYQSHAEQDYSGQHASEEPVAGYDDQPVEEQSDGYGNQVESSQEEYRPAYSEPVQQDTPAFDF